MKSKLKLNNLRLLKWPFIAGILSSFSFPIAVEIYQISVSYLETGIIRRPLGSVGIELWVVMVVLGLKYFLVPSFIIGLLILLILFITEKRQIEFYGFRKFIGLPAGLLAGLISIERTISGQDEFAGSRNWILAIASVSLIIVILGWISYRLDASLSRLRDRQLE